MEFTPEQQAILAHRQGCALITAKAGTGKTTTMAHWVTARVQEGEDPSGILVLMFNRSAKADFEAKLTRSLGRAAPPVRTFNAIGTHFWRRLVQGGHLDHRELLAQEHDYLRWAKECLVAAWKQQHGQRAFPTRDQVAAFRSFITLAKAHIRPFQEVLADYRYSRDFDCFAQALAHLEERMRQERKLTFEDQISLPVSYLAAHPTIWAEIARPLRFIVADEYQDTSEAINGLIEGMASLGGDVLAIGDPDQTIFTWRGSRPEFFEKVFAETYAPVTRYTLSRTFRFGHRVALAASVLINSSGKVGEPQLVVSHPSVPDTEIAFHPQVAGQGTGIVPIVAPAIAAGRLRDCTVLLRFFAHAFPLEVELRRAGVPYHVYDRGAVQAIPAVACLLGVLCLAGGRFPDAAALRFPLWRGLLLAPTLYLRKAELDALVEALDAAWQLGRLSTAALRSLAATPGRWDPEAAKRLLERADAIDLLATPAFRDRSPAQVLAVFMGLTHFEREIEARASTPAEAREQLSYVEAVRDVCATHEALVTALDDLEGLVLGAQVSPPAEDHLALRTIHATKGAEFPIVICPGWGEGAFPREGDALAEERRLAYVAMTRARQALHILHPADPVLAQDLAPSGPLSHLPAITNASRFLFEADMGTALRVTEALSGSATVRLQSRHPRIVRAYLAELGVERVVIDQPQRTGRPANGDVDLQPPAVVRCQVADAPPVVHPVALGAVVSSPVRGLFRVVGREREQYRLEPLVGRRLILSPLPPDEWTLVADLAAARAGHAL